MSIPTTSSRVSGRGFLRPTVGDIHYFAAISDYPCVSILLPTRPQSRMAVDDRARLDGLVRVAGLDCRRRVLRWGSNWSMRSRNWRTS